MEFVLEEILVMVLGKMKELVESYFKCKVIKVVIIVLVFFNKV